MTSNIKRTDFASPRSTRETSTLFSNSRYASRVALPICCWVLAPPSPARARRTTPFRRSASCRALFSSEPSPSAMIRSRSFCGFPATLIHCSCRSSDDNCGEVSPPVARCARLCAPGCDPMASAMPSLRRMAKKGEPATRSNRACQSAFSEVFGGFRNEERSAAFVKAIRSLRRNVKEMRSGLPVTGSKKISVPACF